jgi:hypothetical protein
LTLTIIDHIQLSINEYRDKLYDMITSKKTHIRRIQHEKPLRQNHSSYGYNSEFVQNPANLIPQPPRAISEHARRPSSNQYSSLQQPVNGTVGGKNQRSQDQTSMNHSISNGHITAYTNGDSYMKSYEKVTIERVRRGSSGTLDGSDPKRRGSQGSVGSGHKEDSKMVTCGYYNQKPGAKRSSLEKDDHAR